MWVSAGAAMHTGNRTLSGFFAELRLQLGVVYEEHFDGRYQSAYDVQLGFNVGYQLVVAKRLYLAFMVGATFGGGVGQTNAFSGPFDPSLFVAPRTSFVGGVNANLVRVGFAF